MQKKLKGNIKTSSGFTLVELLISLTITAVVISICAGAFKLGISSVERGNKKKDEQERYVAAVEILEHQLGSLCLKRNCAFSGTEKEIVFYTYYPLENRKESEIAKTTYRVVTDENDQGLNLEISERNAFPLGVEKDDEKFMTILSGMESFSFQYLESNINSKKKWTNKWDNDREFPLAVKVEFRYFGRPFVIISRILNTDKKY